jgi:hypothetical protein
VGLGAKAAKMAKRDGHHPAGRLQEFGAGARKTGWRWSTPPPYRIQGTVRGLPKNCDVAALVA